MAAEHDTFGVWRDLLHAVALLLLIPICCDAALPQTVPGEESPYTLHAYANLIQVPVLILSSSRSRLTEAITPNRLFVSIDSGPWFRASHARQEGDDPISISILLDLRGEAINLMSRADEALASLAPSSLHPNDFVSLYALDCGVIRVLDNAPASSDVLRRGAAEVVRSRRDRIASRERCSQHVAIPETLLHLVAKMNTQTGLRILLVVSAGLDENSRVPWSLVAEAAQARGTAIFAISPQTFALPLVQGVRGMPLTAPETTPKLDQICQLSGGTLVPTHNSGLQGALGEVLAMVRGRYVVSFPRPANSTPGRHTLEVRVDKGGLDFVRPAGISVPIADPATLADPTTVPSDPAIAPVQGRRSPLP